MNADSWYFDTTPTNQFLGSSGFAGSNAKYEIYFNTRL